MPSPSRKSPPAAREAEHRVGPQQDRSIETRRRILAATIACLVDRGYARLTTAAIARQAAVSEGALFRHFATKAALVVAAVEHVFGDLENRHQRLFERVGLRKDRIGAGVAALWRVMTTPEYLATNEVYLAARSDKALREAIRPMALHHQEHLLQRARKLYGQDASPQFDDALDTLILAMQAAAIDSVAMQDKRTDRRRLRYFEAFARLALHGPPSPLPKQERKR